MNEQSKFKTLDASKLSSAELRVEISQCEDYLMALRTAFLNKTGQLPARSLKDNSWRWTIFMVLGFAFISSIVYLLGISKRGMAIDKGIPPFFFQTDFAYFVILTFFVIFMVLATQSEKIAGYQAWALIFGFWCAHWLIYDWSWHAICIGMGTTSLEGFWEAPFYSPLLIPEPPMWLFLTLAILGGIMSLYTFTIPKRLFHLLPPVIWLYTVYFNATLCQLIGMERFTILIMGIVLSTIAFSIAGFFAIIRARRDLQKWVPMLRELKLKFKHKNWSANPIATPWIFALIGMLLFMHLFLVLIPAVGLWIGMIAWYFIPGYYIFVKSSNFKKYSKALKISIAVFYAIILVSVIIFMNLLSI